MSSHGLTEPFFIAACQIHDLEASEMVDSIARLSTICCFCCAAAGAAAATAVTTTTGHRHPLLPHLLVAARSQHHLSETLRPQFLMTHYCLRFASYQMLVSNSKLVSNLLGVVSGYATRPASAWPSAAPGACSRLRGEGRGRGRKGGGGLAGTGFNCLWSWRTVRLRTLVS